MNIYDHISLNSSQNNRFQTEVVEKINTHFMFHNFSKNRIVR